MALYPYGSSSKAPQPANRTEFEILKASHKFLREEDNKNLSWDEQLASKYYSSLYREFAVCDLKHYKSGNFALRWRTEAEVLSGAGETSCGNTRCEHHSPQRLDDTATPPLTTLELPFTYAEQGENKSALVKVVLCERCFGKLMWKRRKEKERATELQQGPVVAAPARNPTDQDDPLDSRVVVKTEEVDLEKGWSRRRKGKDPEREDEGQRRKRSSRSRSPRSRNKSDTHSRRRP